MTEVNKVLHAAIADLRRRCGHDSHSVDGCIDCEAADIIEQQAATIAALRRDLLLRDVTMLPAKDAEIDALRREVEELQRHCNRLTGMRFSERMHAALVSRAEAAERELAAVRGESERRHRLIIHHHADAMELWKALNDLSFECDGVTCTVPPSRETYNRTFAVMKKHRQGYSEEARNNPAGQAIDAATIAALRREVEQIREALAGDDYASLPSDFPLVRMAHTIRADHDKFRNQVRDTCLRAEAAERELADLRDDPNAVHTNMLRGTIAKISMMQCAHVHGEETVKQWSELTACKEEVKLIPLPDGKHLYKNAEENWEIYWEDKFIRSLDQYECQFIDAAIKAARDASNTGSSDELTGDAIQRFAAIIAAKQREKDARICEELMSYDEFSPGSSYAAAIRGQE